MNCPICHNAEHIYYRGNDPKYGGFVLCELHGIQICEQVPVSPKTPDENMQTAYPRMRCLDGNVFRQARRFLRENGDSIHRRSE